MSKLRAPWFHIAAVALLAALDAVLRLGLIHPDEHFQVIEPALKQLSGYGTLPWEWTPAPGAAIRNWALPGLALGALKICELLHVEHPQLERAVIELPSLAIHIAFLAAVFRFSARRIGLQLALWCVWVVGLYGPILWFAGRTLSESVSAPLLAIALERLELRAPRWQVPFAAGLLLGLAEIFRYGSAAAIVFVLLWLALHRRWRELTLTTAGGAVMALGLVALDEATWGSLTLPNYLHFNLGSGEAAARFGSSPWYSYFGWLLLAPSTLFGLYRWRFEPSQRAWSFIVIALGYLAVLMATAHRERRFVYPALVLLTVAATPAVVQWCQQLINSEQRWRGWVLATASALGLAVFYVFPSPFNARYTEVSALTMRAGRDGRGLLLINVPWFWSGGSFYLGRNVPWQAVEGDDSISKSVGDPQYDRAISWNGVGQSALLTAGFTVIQRLGPATLLAR